MVDTLRDATWDSASCVRLRWGALLVPCLKLEPAKTDIKVEKVRPIGEMGFTKRTPGVAEIGDMSVEMLLSYYESLVLPRMPKHGGTLVEWVTTATIQHPSVEGSLGILFDHCRIIGEEGPTFEGTEKALVKKLTLSVMDKYEKGRDGVWKTLVYRSGLPSSTAQAQLKF